MKLANELIPVTGLDFGPVSILGAALLTTLLLFTLIWAFHVKKVDAGIVDFVWGGSFAVIGWQSIALAGATGAVTLLLMALVTLWAARLTAHMVYRHRLMDGEDARYRAMRVAGGPSFWWRSLFTLFWVQALVQWLVASAILIPVLVHRDPAPMIPLLAGLSLFAAGFVIETVADHQLWTFKARPENRGRLMTGGLFAWCRHPNYFGEVVLWWGLGLIAWAGSGTLLVFVGPLLLTGLLLRVSGVSLLDAHLAATKPGYAEWAARTAAFLPRQPRGSGRAVVESPPPR